MFYFFKVKVLHLGLESVSSTQCWLTTFFCMRVPESASCGYRLSVGAQTVLWTFLCCSSTFFCALHNRLHSCWRTYCINGSSSMNPVHMFPTMGPFHSIHTLGDVPDMHLPVRDERGEWGRGKPEGWPLPIRLFLLLVLQLWNHRAILVRKNHGCKTDKTDEAENRGIT